VLVNSHRSQSNLLAGNSSVVSRMQRECQRRVKISRDRKKIGNEGVGEPLKGVYRITRKTKCRNRKFRSHSDW
jgi:hypothetical protein